MYINTYVSNDVEITDALHVQALQMCKPCNYAQYVYAGSVQLFITCFLTCCKKYVEMCL